MHIRESIYLAGLLHDIGKFYQRADDRKEKTSEWTRRFFQEYAANFKAAGFDSNQLASLAVAPHLPEQEDIHSFILKRAFALASGSAGKENDTDSDKNTRLRLVFDFIKIPDQVNAPDTTHIPLQQLSLSESFVLRNTAAASDYPTLWAAFSNEFKHLAHDNPQDFTETLFNLLHKYTVTIPVSTATLPDVSFYDHSRMVAALAVCLYDWVEEKKLDKNTLNQSTEEKPFLLLGGQISGIQNFIYNIISKYAAKNLKGRSFYLELLGDDAVAYILGELKLFSGNVIYNSGGNFYLIAPNTEFVSNKLKEIEYAIQAQLFVKHKTELAMVLATQPVSFEDLQDKKIATPWSKLFDAINAKKAQKHRLVLQKNFDKLFNPQGGSKESTQIDAITGDEIVGKTEYLDDNKTIAIGQYTYEQIALGYSLKDAAAIVETTDEQPYFDEYAGKQKYPPVCDPLLSIGSNYYLINEDGLQQISKTFDNRDRKLKRIIGLNHFDISISTGFAKLQNNKPAWSFKLYGGNQFPVVTVFDKKGEEETEVKTFSEMAGMPEEGRKYKKDFQELPFKRLGVLRMDVDNLGKIFSKGFEGEETLARFASLSRQMDLFFKGYLNTIWASNDDFKSNLQILYAGGDDLFAVGHWASVIKFAKEVRESFRRFTNRNDITISGGVAILPAKFPIGKAALIAGEAEDKAKAFNKNSKNAICIFNEAIGWNGEFAKVEELKTQMVELRKSESLSASFLQQLMRFQMVKNRHETNANYAEKRDLSYVWNAAYAIGRYKERTKNDATKDFLDTTQKYLFAGDTHTSRDRYFDLYAIAARWAELELRSNPTT